MPFVYIARNSKNKLYIGVSRHPYFRLKEHNTQRGSVFTKSGNFKVVFQEEYPTLAEARQREIQIKKWRREKKEQLILRHQKGLVLGTAPPSRKASGDKSFLYELRDNFPFSNTRRP